MLQSTALRLRGFAAEATSAPIVVCNDSHRFVTRRQLQEIGIADAQLIAEPVGRNTAPALTLAALLAAERTTSVDPVLLVMPADHAIPDLASFHAAVTVALRATQAHSGGETAGDAIVTFGIVPVEPATGYGYLRIGGTSAFDPSAFALDRFVKSPRSKSHASMSTARNTFGTAGCLSYERASGCVRCKASSPPCSQPARRPSRALKK